MEQFFLHLYYTLVFVVLVLCSLFLAVLLGRGRATAAAATAAPSEPPPWRRYDDPRGQNEQHRRLYEHVCLPERRVCASPPCGSLCLCCPVLCSARPSVWPCCSPPQIGIAGAGSHATHTSGEVSRPTTGCSRRSVVDGQFRLTVQCRGSDALAI